MHDITVDVKAIIADFKADPEPTATRLRSYWAQYEPKNINGIKAAERARQETLGTPVPLLKKIANPIAREAKLNPEKYLPLAMLLWQEFGREGRVIASIILGKIELAEPANTIPVLYELCLQCHTWEDADRLAMDALEPIVRKEPDRWLSALDSWLEDENKWVRRAGVTVVGRLPMKEPTYTVHCLQMAETLLFDTEEVVKKAVSFAFRLCARGDAAALLDFLNHRVPPTNPAATWVLCDIIRSMSPALKPDFKPLLANYELWAADPDLSGVERRSIISAVNTLRSSKPGSHVKQPQ